MGPPDLPRGRRRPAGQRGLHLGHRTRRRRHQRLRASHVDGGDRVGDRVEIREHVAVRIGKLARPKRIIWSDDLPKTRSGKIMRRLLKDIAEGRELGDVTTLRDPDVMSQLQGRIKEREAQED
jgi:acyl-CoA synthetase (AMP-forming)/AMP-acid ligase II